MDNPASRPGNKHETIDRMADVGYIELRQAKPITCLAGKAFSAGLPDLDGKPMLRHK